MNLVTLLLLNQFSPGGLGEPARQAQFFPGARNAFLGLNVTAFDGLTPASTGTSFDGVKLQLPFHALVGPSTIHSAWTQQICLYPRPANGRSLGNVVDLVLKESKDEDFHFNARLDVLQTGVWMSGVIPQSHTSISGAARFFAIPFVAAKIFGVTAALGDYQVRVFQPISHGNFRLLALGSEDVVALKFSGIPLSARSSNHQIDARLHIDDTQANVQARTQTLGIGVTGDISSNAFKATEVAVDAALKSQGKLGNGTIQVGSDVSVRRVTTEQSATVSASGVDASTSLRNTVGTAVLAGAFTQLEINENETLWALSLRGDFYKPTTAKPFFTIEPLLAVKRKIGETFSINGSVGIFHQAPSWLIQMPILETLSLNSGVQEAVKAQVNANWKPSNDFSLNARVFGIGLTKAIEVSPLDDDFLKTVSDMDNQLAKKTGAGFSVGGEVGTSFKIWSSLFRAHYSLQVSERETDVTRFDGIGLPVFVERKMLASALSQNHQIYISDTTRLWWGIDVSVALTFVTGAPQYGGLMARGQRAGTDSLTGNPKWIPEDLDKVSRANWWVRGDIRISKTFEPKPFEVEIFVDVQNFAVFGQPTGTSYSNKNGVLSTGNAAWPIPIVPVLGVEVRK
jgi:hypothetical protein